MISTRLVISPLANYAVIEAAYNLRLLNPTLWEEKSEGWRGGGLKSFQRYLLGPRFIDKERERERERHDSD